MRSRQAQGFTLVEAIVTIAVFSIIIVGATSAYQKIFQLITVTKIKAAALAAANEQIELIRNLPYVEVGVVNGVPVGVIPQFKTVVRANTTFLVDTYVRNVDDGFDGTIGGSPNDLSPADYKLVQVEVSCQSCLLEQPVKLVTYVAPRNLETASTNGALFVRVFDANGQPVSNADVTITNTKGTTTIVDQTNVSGMLQIVDIPPATEAYRIEVSKDDYSSDQTYATSSGNPNPTKPHATVALQQVTQVSFAIDRTSTLNVSTVDDACLPVPSIPFTLRGTKLIGTAPDVFKYPTQNFTTSAVGVRSVTGLEWDSYQMTLTSNLYDLIGTNPLSLIALAPNSTQDVQLVLAPRDPRTLLVTVKDSNGLPISDASVTLEKDGSDLTLTTGRGAFRQSDWSGGGGQTSFSNPAMYASSDGNLEVSAPAGDVKLDQFSGSYVANGELISSTFDAATTSNFFTIVWQPEDQPALAGPNSVQFQLAANNDQATWNFTGPDGTSGTWYTTANQNIHASISGNRYLRYKLRLETADTSVTPNISNVAVTYTSFCAPPGQVIFTSLTSGTYNLTVSKAGFETYQTAVTISTDATQQQVVLLPD